MPLLAGRQEMDREAGSRNGSFRVLKTPLPKQREVRRKSVDHVLRRIEFLFSVPRFGPLGAGPSRRVLRDFEAMRWSGIRLGGIAARLPEFSAQFQGPSSFLPISPSPTRWLREL